MDFALFMPADSECCCIAVLEWALQALVRPSGDGLRGDDHLVHAHPDGAQER